MSPSLYLVNPASDFATYFSAEILAASGRRAGALIGDLAIATLAAFAPDDFAVTLCDENITPVDLDIDADWIGITGKINQRGRMIALADEFRRRGRKVLIGGPYATLSPAALRPHCDVLVRGEIEEIHAELFADLRAGHPRDEYVGERPELSRSPVPRWRLYPNQRVLMGSVQTSRGCPFECEFCDVIQYLGRKQRHKPINQVLAELDELHARGYHSIFLADDNFTAHRRRTKELLEALAVWQADKHVNLITQISIDAARDVELLDLLAAAGLTEVFIGIETPNEESLAETKKRQNLHMDLSEEIERLVEHGVAVISGMIVGFDADRRDVFRSQYEFAMATPVPIFSLGALVAPEATPLYSRISAEGRLVPGGTDVQAVPWSSNIVPKRMSSAELNEGLQRLCNALYTPAAFGERMLRFIARYAITCRGMHATAGQPRSIDADAIEIAMNVRRMGPEESKMWYRVWSAAARRPETVPLVTRMLFQYAQIRHMFRQGRYWEPRLADSFASSGLPSGQTAVSAVVSRQDGR
jgi:radical SAM superfamily enzyme YgiQ (UPF0313 family)